MRRSKIIGFKAHKRTDDNGQKAVFFSIVDRNMFLECLHDQKRG